MSRDLSPSDSVPVLLNRVTALAHRRARENETCFWIEGIRHFVQAFDAKFTFDAVIESPILLKSDLAEMLARRLKGNGVRRAKVSPEQFRMISTTHRASGIGAIVRQRWTPLEQATPERGICWLIIESIRSPGNLGTILRTAEACGVGGVIFVGPQCDPFDPSVVRASMGGIFHLQLVRAISLELRRWAKHHRMQLVGLTPEARQDWTQLPMHSAIGLVIGEERNGLSNRQRKLCDSMVRLPMTGRADSLNVAVAAGVMMYEVVRQTQGGV